jgi:hypothetical protein
VSYRASKQDIVSILKGMIQEVRGLKEATGSVRQNTLRLGDFVLEAEDDTKVKMTNLGSGVQSYVGRVICDCGCGYFPTGPHISSEGGLGSGQVNYHRARAVNDEWGVASRVIAEDFIPERKVVFFSLTDRLDEHVVSVPNNPDQYGDVVATYIAGPVELARKSPYIVYTETFTEGGPVYFWLVNLSEAPTVSFRYLGPLCQGLTVDGESRDFTHPVWAWAGSDNAVWINGATSDGRILMTLYVYDSVSGDHIGYPAVVTTAGSVLVGNTSTYTASFLDPYAQSHFIGYSPSANRYFTVSHDHEVYWFDSSMQNLNLFDPSVGNFPAFPNGGESAFYASLDDGWVVSFDNYKVLLMNMLDPDWNGGQPGYIAEPLWESISDAAGHWNLWPVNGAAVALIYDHPSREGLITTVRATFSGPCLGTIIDMAAVIGSDYDPEEAWRVVLMPDLCQAQFYVSREINSLAVLVETDDVVEGLCTIIPEQAGPV